MLEFSFTNHKYIKFSQFEKNDLHLQGVKLLSSLFATRFVMRLQPAFNCFFAYPIQLKSTLIPNSQFLIPNS